MQKLYFIAFSIFAMNFIFINSFAQAEENSVKILHAEMKDWLFVHGIANNLKYSLFIEGTNFQIKVDKDGQFHFKTNYLPPNCLLTLELRNRNLSISRSNTYYANGCAWPHMLSGYEFHPNSGKIELIPLDPGVKWYPGSY